MSDRVTNVEIEDVLTSIRKLVADGEWVRQRAAEANAAKGAEPVVSAVEAVDDAGKFVLTPALRVIESRAEVRGKSESLLRFRRNAEPEAINNADQEALAAPEAETAVPEAAEELQRMNDEATDRAETLDGAPEEDGVDETTAEPETISDILEMFDGDEDESVQDLLEEDDAERGSYQSLGAAIAELEAAVGSESDDWEPDGSETVLNDFTTPLRAVGGMDMPDIVDDEDGIDEPQPEISRSGEAIQEEDEASMDMLDGKASSDETPLDLAFFERPRETFSEPTQGKPSDDVEEEAADESSLSFSHAAFDYSDDSEDEDTKTEAEADEVLGLEALVEEPEAGFVEEDLTEEDLVEDEAQQAAVETDQMIDQIADAITETAIVGAASAIEDELDEDLAAYLSEETTLDEDMLRSLVTQVVRSELEGELGERMTRNIRKLVRREVFSILESREAE
ncbi:MAG: hypothetical protein ACO3U1_02045 [Marivivens sp.]